MSPPTAAVIVIAGLTWLSPAQAAASQWDIARGVVTSNGATVSGATVHAYLWPDGDTLESLPDGAQVPVYVLTATTTDSLGRYFVPMASPGAIPAMYKESSGAVSVEVDVIAGGRYMVTTGSAIYNSGAGVWQDAETGTAVTSGSGESLDFGAGTVQNTSFVPPGDEGADAIASGTLSYQGDPAAAAAGTCTWSASTMHYGRPEHFMNVNSWAYAKGTVTEGASSSHTLGIGITADGFSTITAGTTVTLSLSSSSGNVVSQGGLVNQAVYNKVNVRDFRLVCPLGPTGDGRRRPVSTYSFLDGTLQHKISHTNYFSSFQGMKPGGSWSTTNAHAATLGHGFDLGPISVSAQSGFSASTDLTFTFTKEGYVGGNNEDGVLRSSRVDSRSFR